MNRRCVIRLSTLALLAWRPLFAPAEAAVRVNARVVDAVSHAPVADAIITNERPWTEQNREAAIDEFLHSARRALMALNVFLAVDTFG